MSRILVVEDHVGNQTLLKELLEMQGYDVRSSSDANDIVATAIRFRPDLILMDLRLPGLSGFEAIGLLRAEPATASVRIFAVTAFALAEDERKARQLGADDYFSKPLDIPAFLQRVDQALKQQARSH